MRYGPPLLALLLLSPVLGSLPVPTDSQGERLDRIGWLAGCWETQGGNTVVEEQWMRPRGGSMLGMSRTIRAGRTVGWELVRIEVRVDRLVYVAEPSGQAMAEFAEVALTDSLVSFENPYHDFPQRITYRRQSDGALAARVESVTGETPRGFDLAYHRVACP
ncbi:MAG: DUF6265 family protein [Gemmatimonadota bacterium]|nr:DUF6265 family protein [Gemmatimonadota bacterium]MDH3367274.1 DUF6265 family protein [Gemmatimonadota bacterium]MDH3479551.1 DUF6265 family protein [Gemmatimonadota bacterium]MDH3568717.1 DUF6265 family protein [Gemmatimonadota bacterium]MDH5549718.1 DUF6265 family protein [Gemmatimonadota bacterium]